MTVTGLAPEAVGAIALPDALAQMKYWDDYPPLHLMFRAFIGIKDRTEESAESDRSELEMIPHSDKRTFQSIPKSVQQWLGSSGLKGKEVAHG